jgi:hypothetical protein
MAQPPTLITEYLMLYFMQPEAKEFSAPAATVIAVAFIDELK